MKLIFCFAVSVFVSVIFQDSIFAQCTDSTRIPDTYYPCGINYDPVCGCDNITYRNDCAAYNWGGLYGGSWTDGTVCGNFHFDFYPTAIDYYPASFNVFMKFSGTAALYIYDDFGKLQYFKEYYFGSPGKLASPDLVPVQNFRQGIYLAVVVVGGEHQCTKFAKVTIQ